MFHRQRSITAQVLNLGRLPLTELETAEAVLDAALDNITEDTLHGLQAVAVAYLQGGVTPDDLLIQLNLLLKCDAKLIRHSLTTVVQFSGIQMEYIDAEDAAELAHSILEPRIYTET